MSVQSEARYYRLGAPPVVTGDQILEWIKRFQHTGMVDPSSEIALEIDYGKRIGQRHRTDNQFQIVSPPLWKRLLSFRKPYATVSNLINHSHDFEVEADSFEDLYRQFQGGARPIQRAHLMFWTLDEALEQRITSPKSEENPRTFIPFHCGVSVGPVHIYSMAWDDIYEMGYVNFDIFGDGYFYPETFSEWVARCTTEPAIQETCRICREIWPNEGLQPDRLNQKLRAELEHFWPYDDKSGPNDWAWGVYESG